MVGPVAPAMRRRLCPLAWCALEALHESATKTDGGLIADMSMLALASHLGVAKRHPRPPRRTHRRRHHQQAALLVQLVKLTPIGYNKLRDTDTDTDPDQALALLAEATNSSTTREAERRRKAGEAGRGGFDDLEAILPAEAFRHSEDTI